MKTTAMVFAGIVWCLSILSPETGNAFQPLGDSETVRLATLCKVWGFLKYYHPGLADGKVDWDQELVDSIDPILEMKSRKHFDGLILNLVKRCGDIEETASWLEKTSAEEKRNLTLDWLEESPQLSTAIKQSLARVRDARRTGRNHWVAPHFAAGNSTFSNEQRYKEPGYPDESHRLLALFRYWNVIEYFFPQKYVIGKDWNLVLNEFIPRFRSAKDEKEYHLCVMELTTRINDGHAKTKSPFLEKHFGTKLLPIAMDYIDGTLVVSKVYKTLLPNNELEVGDVIVGIDGKPIDEFVKTHWKYSVGANESGRYRSVISLLNRGASSSQLSIQRGEESLHVTVNRYPLNEVGKGYHAEHKPAWKMIGKDVGYIKMGVIEQSEVRQAMQKLKKLPGIVIDLRLYPNPFLNDMMPHLLSKPKPFSRISKPDISRPGVFVTIPGPTSVGPFNALGALFSAKPELFTGKLVVLVNERTFSRGEFFAMAFQLYKNVTVIGSQTGGSNGNVSHLHLPGGIQTDFSGLGVYYPDGRETQRTGIVPDIKIRPTVSGLREGKDEVLERAIQFLRERE